MPGIYMLQSPVDTGDNTLPVAVRDALITGANGGVKFLVDLAFPWCYPGGAYLGRPAAGAPISGATVYDMSENGNASFVAQSGDVTSFAGGGFDFSAVTKIGNYLQGAAAAAASIWASPQQYFLMCAYFKLPTLANWATSGFIVEMFKFAATNYQTGPELALIAQAGNGSLTFRRQNGAGTADTLAVITPNAGDYNSFVQLAYWRDATGQYGRLKSANGVLTTTTTVNSNNTQNFSALTPRLGFPTGFVGANGTIPVTGANNSMKFRAYRAFVENLYVSGRSATAVLDADYTRTVNRNVFS